MRLGPGYLRRAPVFAGIQATRMARENLLSGREMKTALQKDFDPYLGVLPPELLMALRLPAVDVFSALDTLALQIRKKQLKNPPAPDSILPVKLLNYGTGTVVYALQAGARKYAFKVFYLIDTMSYREAATGQYLTARGIKDLSKFHAANPAKGWMLMEYIDASADLSKRPGKTLQELGYRFLDDHADNTINNIRIDYGFLAGYPG